MTIQKLLDGIKVNWMQINVIEQVSKNQYIVGDDTGLAIMEIASDHEKHIEVGQGIRLIKPEKIQADVIKGHDKFSPMKTKPIPLSIIDEKKLRKLRKTPKAAPQKVDYIDFDKIISDYEENSIVSKTLVCVVSVSRLIDGKFGNYRICNIRDKSGQALTLSLYDPHVEKLQDDTVYRLTKLKKSILKNDGLTRLNTTKYTQIDRVSQEEEELFQGIQVADSVIEGCCVMYSNYSSYSACPKHYTKLDEDGECLGCKTKIKQGDAVTDFHCLLLTRIQKTLEE